MTTTVTAIRPTRILARRPSIQPGASVHTDSGWRATLHGHSGWNGFYSRDWRERPCTLTVSAPTGLTVVITAVCPGNRSATFTAGTLLGYGNGAALWFRDGLAIGPRTRDAQAQGWDDLRALHATLTAEHDAA